MADLSYPHLLDDGTPFVTAFRAGCLEPSGELSRVELHSWMLAAGRRLRDVGIEKGDRFLLCMDANHVHDLAWRFAAAALGAIPVTVNWQADSADTIRFKFERTGATAAVVAPEFLVNRGAEGRRLPKECLVLPMELEPEPHAPDFPRPTLVPEDVRIIIFTSGTTGEPKPVALSYGAFLSNRTIFESFLGIREDECLTFVVTNPLHHANSTAMVDWAMRRPNCKIVLLERFSRSFWHVLARVTESASGRVLVPAVSKHFDVLESLASQNALGLDPERLKRALAKVTFLLGSAPVGPRTIAAIQRWTGRLPLVRFGSTELCLQAVGTAPTVTEDLRHRAFVRGWNHTVDGRVLSGFYIGRAHAPWTSVRIVASVDPSESTFFEPVPHGQLGCLVVRSESSFSGYWGDQEATNAAFHQGWYLGLGDHGFMLLNPDDGGEDVYWVGRDAGLMIRGGSNYSCQQIAEELRNIVRREFGLADSDFDLAVIGLKLVSEHEDSCCVMIEVTDGPADAGERLESSFLEKARELASKGGRPDRVVLGRLPRNFKGAIDVRALGAVFQT